MSLVVPLEEIFSDKSGLLSNHTSWGRVKLGDVCDILNGFPFKSTLFNKDDGFPIIRIRDLNKGITETFYKGEVPKEFIVTNGDFLIGMDGNFRCVEWRGGKAGLNQRVCKIIPNEKFINRRFLLLGINGYLKAIEEATSSVTVGHLSSLDILRIPFPFPPAKEQCRIVAKLEQILGKVQDSQKRLAKIPILLKRFRQSVLAAACSGRLTADWREENPYLASEDNGSPDGAPEVPESWTWKLLSVIAETKGGVTKGRKLAGKKTNMLTYLRVANVQDGYLDLSEMKQIEVLPEDKEKYHLEIGDILFTEGGDRDKLGRGTLWRGEIPDCIHQNHIFRARLRSKDVSPEYVSIASKSDFSRRYFFDNANQTVNLASINLTTLSALPLPLAPLAEQQEIVHRIETLFALADKIEARYKKVQAQVNKLSQSILAKAFRGELVPQDPNDEPASALLERIKRERSEDRTALTRGG